MERAMRKQKDRCIVADAAGDEENFTAASIKLRRQKDIYEDFCKAADSYTQYERTYVAGYNRRLAGKTGAVTRKQREFDKAQMRLTDSQKSGTINTEIKNAVGKPVKIVKQSDVKITGEPNLITQTENAKGGITRNYYGEDGIQTKQISNNDHGHKAESKFGKHGEHAHDYYKDQHGQTRHGKARELTDQEREENDDIL